MTATARSTAPLLEVRGLRHAHDGRPVLDGVDLALHPGQVLGLVGRNGAGKTTLLRAALGVDALQAGEARLFGASPAALDDAGKRRLGYVPQEPASLGWMTATEVLAFMAALYPTWDHALVARLLARWAIPTDRPLQWLSPGERQRVALLRALGPRPDLLVLDEPASALDPAGRRALLQEIVDLCAERGSAVLLSTHILSDLERVASDVAILEGGRIRLRAGLDALRERHLRLHVPAALAALAATPLPGEWSRRTLPGGALSLLVERVDGAPWPPLAERAEVLRDAPRLEELFLEMVAERAA
jgi:ABC-2 type transport system ATP-binding protein